MADVRFQKKYTAPVDFEELYREYRDFVVATLVKMGVEPQDAPDAAHNLLIRFYEKGGLSWYDEKKIWVIGVVNGKKVTLKPGQPVPEGFVQTGARTAAFMGMFKTWIGLSALGERDKIQNRKKRETLGGGMAGDEEVPHLSVQHLNRPKVGAAEPGLFMDESVALRASVDRAKAELADKGQSRLLEEIENMMEEDGKLDRKVLAQRMGYSPAELGRQISSLRSFLADRALAPREVAV